MTVQDASNDLFTWFETNDSFEIGRDLKTIHLILEDEDIAKITFKIALEALEKMELVSSKTYGDKIYYILNKHMDAFQQNVDVGPWTAKFMSHEINEFCSLIEDNADRCETAGIKEKDIQNLIHIIAWYKARVLEKEQIISGTTALSDLLSVGPEASMEYPEGKENEKPKTKNKKKKDKEDEKE